MKPQAQMVSPQWYSNFSITVWSHTSLHYSTQSYLVNFSEAWSLGSIKPIYKKGDKSHPSNYRSITLLNVMGKVFSSILQDRISEWAEANGILNESQFGFRENRRTTDAIFILNTITQILKKKRKPLYTCFIDFSTALGKVHHRLLWEKLASVGLSSKILAILQNMYMHRHLPEYV